MTAQLLLLRAMPAQHSVAHAMRLYCAAVLRCCTALLHVGRGLERRFQPCTKLFAKEAVQIVAVNLIWACVGDFYATCASRGDVCVCMRMYVTDTVDVVLCCPLIYALPREIVLSNRSMSHRTGSAQKEERPWPTVSTPTRPSRRYAASLHGHVWRMLCCCTALLHCAAARRQGR